MLQLVPRASTSRLAAFVAVAVGLLLLLIRAYRSGGAPAHGSRRLGASGKAKAAGRSSSSKRRSAAKPDDDAVDPSLPQFIMLVGIPGSGKSTWAREYVFKCDASFGVISSDEVRQQLTGDINDQSRNPEVWEIVLNQVQGALAAKRNVILDATNTRTDKRRGFLKKLPACTRWVKMFPVNKSIAKSRIRRDIASGVKRSEVPDGVVDLMYREFCDAAVAVRDEGWRVKV
jgi:predicted kinase